MRNFLIQVGNVLCPPYCVICGELLSMEEWEDCCCKGCRGDMPYIRDNTCSLCGASNTSGALCFSCHQKKPVFAKAISAFTYETVAQAIHRFKFQGAAHDGKALGRLMGEFLLEQYPHWLQEIDVMTAIPLHKKKVKERGFNQADLLCKAIAKITGLVYERELLERIKYTVPQSRLSPEERKANIHGVFQSKACKDQRIILVDDIFTTGVTVSECSRVLYRAGAKEVRVFCLSQTVELFDVP